MTMGTLCLGECCCPPIGYEKAAWVGVTNCCTPAISVPNIADNIGLLTASLKNLFMGHTPGACSNAIHFAAGDWPAVKSWLNAGGRLWCNLEYLGCMNDKANANAFLAAMGSGITWGETHETDEIWLPGDANISKGLPAGTFATAEMSKILGGTTVWVNAAGHAAVAVEKLVNGFLFVCGDSEAVTNGQTNCSFIKRLWEYADSEII